MKKLVGSLVLSLFVLPVYATDSADEKCNHIVDLDKQMQCLADYLDSLPRPRFSDRALKQNEVVVKDALNKITRLNGKYFEWKSDNRKDIGVIAQEVETVFPELVIIDKKTQFKQVNYAGLIGVLIEAVKELKKENETLKQQLGLSY
ncbi:tail fiber domain-containing protein [Zooshikella ganghwensis]|uniref:Tail fiber domain-containing protein n=1 Tax=Zooshikella ganghwensis TaxID=202772 RepID=A0A4P9VLM9_9GAMM|nr:tail fiber domain-containing protein [Zooshikella ganghwensis]RDH44268.1 tail fiber domain-containing protein [Zooshikella ganghwensis]